MIFFRKILPNWVYFGQGEDFKVTAELSKTVQYSRNQAIKNSLLMKQYCLSYVHKWIFAFNINFVSPK